MRNARILRRELDLWKLAWQQIETYLDRIEGARDQDEPHRRKVEALLRAAAVVEHRRAVTAGTAPLSDPVVDRQPTTGVDAAGSVVSVSDPWDLEECRQGRIPGTDELELAVGMLDARALADDDHLVRLPRPRHIFTDVNGEGERETVDLPSYPGGNGVTTSIVGGGATAGVGQAAGVESLFSHDERRDATLSPDLLEQPGDEDVDEDEPLRSWSALCAERRGGAGAELYTGVTSLGGGSSSVAGQAATVAAALRVGLTPGGQAVDDLDALADAARAAASATPADAATLRDAAEVVEDEGATRGSLPGDLTRAADFLAASPAALLALADAADDLRESVPDTLLPVGSMAGSTDLAAFEAATAAVTPGDEPPLFATAVEHGPLQADLDEAAGARIAYPDGTLRILRTLEWGFVGTWSARLRWFRQREESVLGPLARRFRAPFAASVRALVDGGATGLVVAGLTATADLDVDADAAVGSDTVVTDEPASLLSAVADAVEPGTVGVTGGDRPTALVLLGFDQLGGRLALKVPPLRVSTAEGPGNAGVLPAGTPITDQAPGLTAVERRTGESAAGATGDGLVAQTVSLWSRLCLVFGWKIVERDIQGAEVGFSQRTLPDPSSARLRDLKLHGVVPPLATALVITGAPDAYWDRSQSPPQPRVARPGEVLLLRGLASPQGAETAPRRTQAAVEVEQVVRIRGSDLDHMVMSGVGQLSTTPLAESGPSGLALRCGRDEDVILVLLRRSWMARELTADAGTPLLDRVSLHRDFEGFDLPSLGAEQLLPLDFLSHVQDRVHTDAVTEDIDRQPEFDAALETLAEWTRYARG